MSSPCAFSIVSFLRFGFDDESRNIGTTAQTRNSNMAASTGVPKTAALEASLSALFLTCKVHMCCNFRACMTPPTILAPPMVNDGLKASPTSFHISRANAGKEVTFSPAFVLLKCEKVGRASTSLLTCHQGCVPNITQIDPNYSGGSCHVTRR